VSWLLDVRNLGLDVAGRPLLRDLSIQVGAGEAAALTGPSGAGKTLSALAILGLLPPGARVAAGEIRYDGRDLAALDHEARRRLRGRQIAMVFQEALSALHPTMTIGAQIGEMVSDSEALALLRRAGLRDAARCAASYPHELSGGERQRALIALALAGRPRLLIADEPTSALDPPLRREILDLLAELRRDLGLALLVITHDRSIASQLCDRVIAIASPPAVERRRVEPATPRGTGHGARLLEAKDLVVIKGARRILDGVDFTIDGGECVAIVGPSGSGKTTLARALLWLVEPNQGRVLFRGHQLGTLPAPALRRLRRRFQIVIQDPSAALDPRQRVGAAVAEPLEVHGLAAGDEAAAQARDLLGRCGLPSDAARRYPHEFSGGQRQRIALARAIAGGPDLLVADEPVSALDAPLRAQITELLAALRRAQGLALVVVAHDLALVERLADRVVFMHAGRVVEEGAVAEVLSRPRHPEARRWVEAGHLV
jgi:peptide/nickel transport system ATP-binding protein